MTIGQVAEESGFAASAIRYYEQIGVLPRPVRAGGRRQYDRSILERLAVLERAKACGLSLAEMRQLLYGFREGTPPSERWQTLARRKIAELEELERKIAATKELLQRACACKDLAECGRRIRRARPEKQYTITKAQFRRFQDALAELAGRKRPTNITPRLWHAQRQAAESQMDELREQVEAYERLQMGKSKEVVLESVEDLPKALIRARIAAGMTQEGLARRLGVKPQQVQRYEASEYGSASFARIVKVLQALGLTLPKAARLVRNG